MVKAQFASENTFTPYYPPPSIILNYEYGNDSVTITVQSPINPYPHQLLSVEVYKDGEFFLTWQEQWLNYVDEDLIPGMHEYCAVAKYTSGSSQPECESVNVCACNPPKWLDARWYTDDPPVTRLRWKTPDGWPYFDDWIRWDDGDNYDAIGTGSQVTFDVAAKWKKKEYPRIADMVVSEVSFFPDEADADYSIRIWQGGGSVPDTMLIDYPVENPLIGEWNTVSFSEGVEIDYDKHLWIGYRIETNDGYPAGVDDGPAIDNSGNVMYFGGWTTLLEVNPDLDYNWNIAAHLLGPAGRKVQLSRSGNPELGTSAKPKTSTKTKRYYDHYYKIYRCNEDLTNFYLIDSIGPYELEYFDQNFPPPIPWAFGYTLKAFYSYEGDTCVSDFSNEALIVPVSIDEEKRKKIRVFPNPAQHVLNIESEISLEYYYMTDIYGHTVITGTLKPSSQSVDVSSLGDGLYLLRLWSKESMLTRKVVVAKR